MKSSFPGDSSGVSASHELASMVHPDEVEALASLCCPGWVLVGFTASKGKYCKRQKGKPSFLAAHGLCSCRARAPPAPGVVLPSVVARALSALKLCEGACSALLGLPGSLPVLLPSLFSNLPGRRAAVTCGVCDPPGLGNQAGPFLISAAEGCGQEAAGYGCSGASTLAAVTLCTPVWAYSAEKVPFPILVSG